MARHAVEAFSLSLKVENSLSTVNISWLFSQAVASAGYFKAFLSSHLIVGGVYPGKKFIQEIIRNLQIAAS